MRLRAWGLLALLLLSGCVTAAPKVEVQRVLVPTPVACVPDNLPKDHPAYPDSDAALKAAPGPGEMLVLLASGRLLRQTRLDMLEATVAACRLPDSLEASKH